MGLIVWVSDYACNMHVIQSRKGKILNKGKSKPDFKKIFGYQTHHQTGSKLFLPAINILRIQTQNPHFRVLPGWRNGASPGFTAMVRTHLFHQICLLRGPMEAPTV